MNDDADHDERLVHQLLTRINEHVAPTSRERARIAGRMWAAADSSQTVASEHEQPSAGDSEIVRLVSDEAPNPPKRLPRWVLAAAAIIAVVASAALVLRTSEDPPMVSAADAGTAQLVVGGLEIQFDSHDTYVLRHTEDLIELEVGTLNDRFDPGRMTLTRAVDPLLTSDPTAWFQQSGLRAQPQSHFYNDELIDSFAVYTTSTSVNRFDCTSVGPCVPLLEGTSDTALFIQRGNLNRIDMIDAPDGGQPLVVLWFADNNGVVSPNPLLETLRIREPKIR